MNLPIPFSVRRSRTVDSRYRLQGRKQTRRGSITVLSAFMLTVLLIVAGMCVNLTQLSVAKTEIRLACDAAAKAGAVALGQSQDTLVARAAAQDVAANHAVNGYQILLRNVDVEFGHSHRHADGRFIFERNMEPLNAVRVFARMSDNAATPSGQYFFQGIGDTTTFDLNYEAIATRVDHDLCLVVDRSGSMAWDLSNVAFQYPEVDEEDSSIIQNYFLPPHPTLSRWAALRRTSDVFFEELEDLPIEVQVGLVSYSSNFIFGLYDSEASTVESELTEDYDFLSDRMEAIGQQELIGNTNVASGMQAAVRVLTGNGSRITAKGTMVVLTDGIWNQGRDPVEVAAAARDANLTVHTITFSDQADQETMAAAAAAGAGNHYHAPDEATLRAVFSEIAATLPAVLTQ